jgi:hypothetical protein
MQPDPIRQLVERRLAGVIKGKDINPVSSFDQAIGDVDQYSFRTATGHDEALDHKSQMHRLAGLSEGRYFIKIGSRRESHKYLSIFVKRADRPSWHTSD